MQLDHVVLAASTRPPEVPHLPPRYGLEAIPGGHHPGWGTSNWIVPLGDAYLELIAVVDASVARESAFGRRVLQAHDGGAIGWAVRPDDLDETADRLGLRVGEGSRTRPSGERVEWRMAGVDEAMERPWLPFFVEWRDPAVFPGSTHTPPARVTRIELEGDVDELSGWLGPHSLPLDVRPGYAGPTAFVLETRSGPVSLGRPPGV